jgi:hypothetical protein
MFEEIIKITTTTKQRIKNMENFIYLFSLPSLNKVIITIQIKTKRRILFMPLSKHFIYSHSFFYVVVIFKCVLNSFSVNKIFFLKYTQ